MSESTFDSAGAPASPRRSWEEGQALSWFAAHSLSVVTLGVALYAAVGGFYLHSRFGAFAALPAGLALAMLAVVLARSRNCAGERPSQLPVALAAGLSVWIELLDRMDGFAPGIWILSVPIVAFASLRLVPAWTWSLAAAGLSQWLPMFVSWFRATDIQAAEGRAAFFRILPVVALALGATLPRLHFAAALRRLQKEAQDRRQSELRAIASSQAKSRQIVDVSHELRTPLNGILGLLELVLERELPEDDRRRIEWAHSSGEALLSLLDDLLDLDRIEAGRLELRPRPFDSASLVLGIERLLGSKAHSKGLALQVETDPAMPAFLVGDSARLRQVLLNLVGNAVKFTRRGAITISTKVVESVGDSIRCRFEVRDTGPGISPDRCRRLFVRHEARLHSDSRAGEGRGLGLAISRELVSAMSGEIGVESELGTGSTFWFELWLGKAPDAYSADSQESPGLPAALSRAPRRAGDLRLLVVEDDFISREVSVGQLRSMGFACDAVGSGEEALERAEDYPYDAVLMDVELPGCDGLEAARRLRRLKHFHPNLVIVAVTASALPSQRTDCLEAGMNDVLVKPVALRTLRQTLEFWLNCATRHHREEDARPASSGELNDSRNLPAIDDARLRELASLEERLGRKFLPELIENFRERSSALLAKLAVQARDADTDGLRITAHALSGGASNLGAVRLARTSRWIENSLLAGRLDALEEIVERVRRETDQALAALGQRFPPTAASDSRSPDPG